MRTFWIILACLACLVVGVVGGFIAGLGVNFSRLADRMEIKDANVHVAAPGRARVGEQFDIVVTVTDISGSGRRIHDIDVEETYLEGLSIVRVTPEPRTTDSLVGYATHTMNVAVPASGAATVTFTVRAARAGTFSGDVDVYVDSDFAFETVRITTMVE